MISTVQLLFLTLSNNSTGTIIAPLPGVGVFLVPVETKGWGCSRPFELSVLIVLRV